MSLARLANNYNEYGVIFSRREQPDSAIHYYRESLEIRRELHSPDIEIARLLNNMGICMWMSHRYAESIDTLNIALSLRRKVSGPIHFSVGRVLTNLARAYVLNGQSQKAIRTYQEAIDIYMELGSAESTVLRYPYTGLGVTYYNRGNYELAQSFLERAQSLYQERYGPDHPSTLGNKINLCKLLYAMGRHEESVQMSLNLVKSFTELKLTFDLAIVYGNLMDCRQAQGLFDESLVYASIADSLYFQVKGPVCFERVEVLNSMGDCFRELGEFEQSRKVFEECLSVLFQLPQHKSSRALTQHGIGQAFLAEGDFEKASTALEKGVMALWPNIRFPSPIDFESPHLLSAILADQMKGYFQSYKSSRRPQDLQQAISAMQKFDQVVSHRRSSFQDIDSKLRLSVDTKFWYGLGLKICSEWNKIEPTSEALNIAFNLLERYRAQTLLANSRDEGLLMKLSGVADSLIIQRAELREKVSTYRSYLALGSMDSIAAKEKVHSLQVEYSQFEASLFSSYPACRKLFLSPEVVTLRESQRFMRHNYGGTSAALSYFTWGDSIFILQMTPDKLLLECRDKSGLTEKLQNVRLACHGGMQPDRQELLELSGILIPTQGQMSGVDRWVILPDAELHDFPFELIFEARTQPQTAISYANSLSLLQDVKHAATGVKKLVAFAPSYSDHLNSQPDLAILRRGGTYDLPGAREEARKISDLLGGDLFEDSDATESNFKLVADQYDILHLAVHGKVDEDNPAKSKLLFHSDDSSDGFLHAAELYNLRLQAKLVVISACNAGVGQEVAGEGVLSLSRAFHHANVPSVITTLWEIPDQSAAIIMPLFYQNIESGQELDLALASAKRSYLEQVLEPELRRPLYWAGFVLSGKNDALARAANFHWLWISLIAIFLSFLFRFFFRRYRLSNI